MNIELRTGTGDVSCDAGTVGGGLAVLDGGVGGELAASARQAGMDVAEIR